MGFFPLSLRGSLGIWSKARSDGRMQADASHRWSSISLEWANQLQQPHSQQEQIPERSVARGIKSRRDSQCDGEAVAINQQEAAAPLTAWKEAQLQPAYLGATCHTGVRVNLLPGSRQDGITSLSDCGLRDTWNVGLKTCKDFVTMGTSPPVHLLYRKEGVCKATRKVRTNYRPNSSNLQAQRPCQILVLNIFSLNENS